MISGYLTHHDVKTHRSKKHRKRGGLNEARRRRGDERKATKKILISPPERARKVRYFVPQRPVDLVDRKISDGRGTTRRTKNRRRFSPFASVPSDSIARLRTSVDPMENKKIEGTRCASWNSADDVTGACFGCLPWRRDPSPRILHRTDRHQCGGRRLKSLRRNLWDIQAAIPYPHPGAPFAPRDARITSPSRSTGRDLAGQISTWSPPTVPAQCAQTGCEALP
jgi:hypothetical protein